MAAIKKIMEKEQALAVLDEIKNNICEVDLDELCGEKTEIVGDNKDEIYKKVVQAVMCGLVYWDEENYQNMVADGLANPHRKIAINLAAGADFKRMEMPDSRTPEGMRVIKSHKEVLAKLYVYTL